ncbi:ATP synthase subunit delta, mitochondrial isoform X1 [Cherax quadricarinatus]|uniref:ATP synthase subunit delta, mitochondrial isoform X1 n=1 Tax=Cherax quadricarinatus TaxID=27406 RepID=UPI00237845A4|nr:ATP synthase subunit delta, mitochondrial-like isoform X1 [Cherax quadricarinatus]
MSYSSDRLINRTLWLKMFSRAASTLVRRVSLVGTRSYSDGPMAFTFASQNQVFYNGADVRQVDVPSFSGSFGILPKHVPSLAVLKPGVLTVLEADGAAKKYFVSSGIVTINEDSSVQILAEEAAGVEELDLGAARDILSKAHSEANAATSEEAKAEALIKVEVAEELVKAAESG